MKGPAKAVARLTKEIKTLQNDMPPGVLDMHLSDQNMHLLHFVLAGPSDTPYTGGVYILKILLPPQYPFKAPDFFMMTPNGRFGVNCKICTTFSSFHPETWTPSYTLTTLLVSFLSFFVDSDAAAGAVQTTVQQKKQYAKDSVAFNKRASPGSDKYVDMLPILKLLKPGLTSDASLKKALAERYPEKAAAAAAAASKSTAATTTSSPASAAAPATAPTAPAASAAAPASSVMAAKATASSAAAASVDLVGAAPPRSPASNKRKAPDAKPAAPIVLDDDPPSAKAMRPAKPPSAPRLAAAGGGCVDLT